MTQLERITTLLGGPELIWQAIRQESDLETMVREGLPAESVRQLAASTGTTLTALQEVTRIDRSTFGRRVRQRSRLKTDESDRVVRVARIAALAIAALGNQDGIAWLHEENWALGQRAPIDLLATEVGARQVEQIIGRIEHGVFS
ncbi:MAG: antitoxin Xre/MbcA/ParS toxin-binding domain-containing protein [Candidatus Tumulicola sp.]